MAKKLLALQLLGLVGLIGLTAMLFGEMQHRISLARSETTGLAYLQASIDPLILAARPGAGTAHAAMLKTAAQQVRATQALHAMGGETSALAEVFAQSLDSQLDAGASGAAWAAGRALLAAVGDHSRLVLDPELDSYYAMSVALFRLPDLIQAVSGLGADWRDRQPGPGTSTDMRARQLLLDGQLDAFFLQLKRDHRQMVAHAAADAQPDLLASLARLDSAIQRYRQVTTSLNQARPDLAQAAQLEAVENGLFQEVEANWITVSNHLSKLLSQRVAQLAAHQAQLLGIAGLILLAMLVVGRMVANSIAEPLHQLARAAESVAASGDFSVRVAWRSGDEIGRLVGRFNGMLSQLHHHEQLQVELAATARAAEAQCELVDKMPLPVMVTSISTHSVLYANLPAQRWLPAAGEALWHAALEEQTRQRLFQLLAQHGQVDEFEVRWCAGTEPGWAVLSARRLRFQDQDALLTAVAPINHLKVMESRLRLWSKVFDASSEGICMLNAAGSILAGNLALLRSTDQTFDAIVDMPARQLFVDLPADLWTAVDADGTWRGEVEVRRRDGAQFPAWLIATGVCDYPGEVTHYIFTTIDITDRKRSERRMRFLAEHDVLTELPNRGLATETLHLAIEQAQQAARRVAVLVVDLDDFKDINESLGHHIGDGLLRSVSNRLLETVRAGDLVARLGGDEFLVVLYGVNHIDEVMYIVNDRLAPRIRDLHPVGGAELHVSCSIGIALYPDDGSTAEALMQNADAAMHQAKSDGKDAVRFFNPGMAERARTRVELAPLLRNALALGQFELHYQPRMDAKTGTMIGAEALIRWAHPQHGLVPPAHFIPLAEATGLIVPIGQWVIEEACRQGQAWRLAGFGPLSISVNVSARQMRDDLLVEVVRAALTQYDVAPGCLELELTESLIMDDAERSLKQMHALRALGVVLSIDDFGTGYSSLAYLNKFPINKLKIDRAFVRNIMTNPTDRAITRAVINLGHTIGLTVVAEGVETAEVAQDLREAGCDELQGYFLGRPVPATALQLRLPLSAAQTEPA